MITFTIENESGELKQYKAVEVPLERENSVYENFKEIKDIVSLCTGIDNLEDKTRKGEVVQARQLAQFFAYIMYNNNENRWDNVYSLAEIGYNIGRKDHATVLNSVAAVKNSMIYKAEKETMIEISKGLGCQDKLESFLIK